MIKVAPSILSADFATLGHDIDMLNRSEADYIHLDIMDGLFVPNISFGFPVIKSVNKLAQKPMDAHLMIMDPSRYVGQVRDCGAEYMTVHQEACTHLHRTVQQIKAAGMKAGVALNPATPVVLLEDIIGDVDLVLIMSVNPGFGGQSFIPQALNKVRQAKELIVKNGSNAVIQVDGGVNLTTGALLAEAGADILVAGNFVFSSSDPAGEISRLRKL